MISQNRADVKRQLLADQQWQTVQTEEKQNEDPADDLKTDSRADAGDPHFDKAVGGPVANPPVT